MAPQKDSSNDQIPFRKFILGSARPDLQPGSFVEPGTVIGTHQASGQPVKAGMRGRIVSIFTRHEKKEVVILVVSGEEY